MANIKNKIASNRIRVYPCAWRGLWDGNKQTSAQNKKLVFDPASRHYTDENARNHIKGLIPFSYSRDGKVIKESGSFIISSDFDLNQTSSKSFKFVLNGYYFEIINAKAAITATGVDLTKDIYAHIVIRSKINASDNEASIQDIFKYTDWRMQPITNDASITLKSEELDSLKDEEKTTSTGDNYLFDGLIIDNTDSPSIYIAQGEATAITTDVFTLQLFDSTGKVPNYSTWAIGTENIFGSLDYKDTKNTLPLSEALDTETIYVEDILTKDNDTNINIKSTGQNVSIEAKKNVSISGESQADLKSNTKVQLKVGDTDSIELTNKDLTIKLDSKTKIEYDANDKLKLTNLSELILGPANSKSKDISIATINLGGNKLDLHKTYIQPQVDTNFTLGQQNNRFNANLYCLDVSGDSTLKKTTISGDLTVNNGKTTVGSLKSSGIECSGDISGDNIISTTVTTGKITATEQTRFVKGFRVGDSDSTIPSANYGMNSSGYLIASDIKSSYAQVDRIGTNYINTGRINVRQKPGLYVHNIRLFGDIYDSGSAKGDFNICFTIINNRKAKYEQSESGYQDLCNDIWKLQDNTLPDLYAYRIVASGSCKDHSRTVVGVKCQGCKTIVLDYVDTPDYRRIKQEWIYTRYLWYIDGTQTDQFGLQDNVYEIPYLN